MRGPARVLGVVLGLVAATACGRSPSSGPPTAAVPTPVVATAAPAAGVEKPIPEVPVPKVPPYQAKGRRDPFEVLEVRTGTARSIASARLVGIVRGPRVTLALVETSEGLGYIMKPGDTLGDSRLTEIDADSVVFTTTPKPGAAPERVVLRMPAD